METASAIIVVALMLVALCFGISVLVAVLVNEVRARLAWGEPGLPLHELIAPTGELQDPQYGDRRRRPSDEVRAARPEIHSDVPLMSRAPWTVQKGGRSVHHG